MWQSKGRAEIKKGDGNGLVAVAIDKDKGSQAALKWTVENLIKKGQPIILVHVVQKSASKSLGGRDAIICDINNSAGSPHRQQLEKQTKDLFLSFHCYCTRKDIQCIDVILEDVDVVKSLTEYASYAAIQNLVLGSPSKHGFIRFKASSIPSSVSKGAPDFCTVYVISKGKISSVRNASRPAPYSSPLLNYVHDLNKDIVKTPDPPKQKLNARAERPSFKPRPFQDESIRSPFARGRGVHARPSTGAFSESDTDISFISSSDRASTDRPSSVFYDYELGRNARLSTSSDSSFGSFRSGPKLSDLSSLHDVSSFSQDSGRTSLSWSSQNMEDVEAEMRRLKLELKQTIDMYSAACREALTAKQKEVELNHLRFEEERKVEEARLAEEAALALAEKEKARAKAALEAAEAAKKIAEVESQKRASAENKSLREVKEMKKLLDNLAQSDGRYRRYAIEEIEIATDYFTDSRKIGEGGYGPVFKCYLDHTPVAVKVLRPDAAQGRSQFQQEVDILSCIRHPNMVLLLGACPEYGILVYEYMANGSLDDRLFRRGNTTVLPWQIRFRIAAEIATGLLFLHQTKPEPLVHRDLKPGNILLDYNYVSKISDVGLARLVPAVAENVTQYHMTSTAGTFCYIDPEYQQTGMLGVKSDVYSLGIMLLQMITAKPPMGLAHHIQISIEREKFAEMLDPAVTDWPLDETLTFAKLALQCSELRRKDRPDLGTEILPLLSKLRDFADSKMNHMIMGGSVGDLPHHHHVVHQEVFEDMTLERNFLQEVMSDPLIGISNSSISSLTGGTHSSTE